jgi:hypothetical protein
VPDASSRSKATADGEDDEREGHRPALDDRKPQHDERDGNECRRHHVHHVAPHRWRGRPQVVAGRERAYRRQPDAERDPRPPHDQAGDLVVQLLARPRESRRHSARVYRTESTEWEANGAATSPQCLL